MLSDPLQLKAQRICRQGAGYRLGDSHGEPILLHYRQSGLGQEPRALRVDLRGGNAQPVP